MRILESGLKTGRRQPMLTWFNSRWDQGTSPEWVTWRWSCITKLSALWEVLIMEAARTSRGELRCLSAKGTILILPCSFCVTVFNLLLGGWSWIQDCCLSSSHTLFMSCWHKTNSFFLLCQGLLRVLGMVPQNWPWNPGPPTHVCGFTCAESAKYSEHHKALWRWTLLITE